MTVKEVDINGKVGRVIVVEVGSALALVIATLITDVTAPYCTRFCTTRLYAASKAVDKGIVVYKCDYILSNFN